MKNAWGIQPNHVGQEGSINELATHATLEKSVKDAILLLELSQHKHVNAPHGKLLAWEALDILRRGLRGNYG